MGTEKAWCATRKPRLNRAYGVSPESEAAATISAASLIPNHDVVKKDRLGGVADVVDLQYDSDVHAPGARSNVKESVGC